MMNFTVQSKTLKENLPNLLSAFTVENEKFVKALLNIQSADSLNLNRFVQVKQTGIDALNSSNIFMTGITKELEILLQIRMQQISGRKNLALTITGCTLLFALFLIIFISRQTANHVRIVKDIAELIAKGKIAEAAKFHS